MSQKSQMLSFRSEEVNLALNGIVGLQNRVKPSHRSWTDTLSLPTGRVITLRCVTTEDQVVPHGLDNDFQAGLQNLFLAQDCPQNNRVAFTMHALIQASGLDSGGRYYDKGMEALQRMKAATFSFEGGWHDGTDWVTVQFSLIERLVIRQRQRAEVHAGDLIEVQLPSELAESLRRGYVKTLNAELLRKLKQPSARTLYRLLDGIRYAGSPGPMDSFTVNLEDWGRRCRLFDARSHRIRETLEPAHDALLETRYLQEVSFEGRGLAQQVRYVFSPTQDVEAPQLMTRLEAAGVVPKVARDLISLFGPLEVARRLTEVELIRSTSRTPLGVGFVVKFIRNPETYSSPAGATKTPQVKAQKTLQPSLLTLMSEPTEDDLKSQAEQQWAAMTPARQRADAVKSARLMYHARLTASDYDELARRIEAGELDALAVRAEAARAAAAGTLDSSASALRSRLKGN